MGKKNLIVFEDSSKVFFGGGQKGTLQVIRSALSSYNVSVFDCSDSSYFQHQLTAYKSVDRQFLKCKGVNTNSSKSSFSVSLYEVISFPFFSVYNLINVFLVFRRKSITPQNSLLYTSSKKHLFLVFLFRLISGYRYYFHYRTFDDVSSPYYAAMKIPLMYAEKVFCVSRFIMKTIGLNNMALLYNPVSLPQNICERNLDLLNKRPVVAFVGQLLLWKGIECFLRVSELDVDGIFEYHVYGAGNVSLYNGRYPKVLFFGFNENMDDVYASNIDIVVSSSISPESFGRTTVEAAAYGIPCVSTDIGAQPELIMMGNFGLLVPINSPDDIFQSLLFLRNNKSYYRFLSRNAIEFSRNMSEDIFSFNLERILV